MPVQNRKYFISRHNHDCEEENKNNENGDTISYTGEATSEYSQLSINDYKYLGPR
jgi:hypothetical protein